MRRLTSNTNFTINKQTHPYTSHNVLFPLLSNRARKSENLLNHRRSHINHSQIKHGTKAIYIYFFLIYTELKANYIWQSKTLSFFMVAKLKIPFIKRVFDRSTVWRLLNGTFEIVVMLVSSAAAAPACEWMRAHRELFAASARVCVCSGGILMQIGAFLCNSIIARQDYYMKHVQKKIYYMWGVRICCCFHCRV